MQRFGEKLRVLRTARGLTVRELVVNLGFSVNSSSLISEIENGHRKPNLDFVLKVADYFGVSVDLLVHDSENLP